MIPKRRRKKESRDGLAVERKKQGWEARLDRANSNLHICSSSAPAGNCWNSSVFVVHFILHQLQDADAEKRHRLQAAPLLLTLDFDFCGTLNHQVWEVCGGYSQDQGGFEYPIWWFALGRGSAGGGAYAYDLLPALLSLQVVATDLGLLLVLILFLRLNYYTRSSKSIFACFVFFPFFGFSFSFFFRSFCVDSSRLDNKLNKCAW